VLIGMEATGNSQWFVELVEDLGHEIWIGNAAQIRASYVRQQKTDKRDAAHILKLVLEGVASCGQRTGSSAICGS
jgi:transposase